MSEFGDVFSVSARVKKKRSRVRPWVMLVTPLVAILFQVYVPLYVHAFDYLELPLLVTLYLAMSRRSQVAGMFIGAAIGLVQDSLSSQPIGIIGMVKTVIGYAAASLGVRLDTDHVAVRFMLGLLLFAAHQLLHGLIRAVLLGQPSGMEVPRLALGALINASLAIPIFFLLDKLKEDA